MAIAANHLSTDIDTTSGTSITSSSISPTANALILVAISAGNLDANADPPTPSVSGNGITYSLVDSAAIGTRRRVWVFRGMSASPSTGAVTASFGSTNVSGNIIVDEFSGVDSGGSNGSGAVVQSASATGSATTLSATLAAFADAANNAAHGSFSHQASEGTAPGSGFTELGDSGSNIPALQTEWRAGQDTSVDASWATSSNAGAVAIGIKAAAAGREVIGRGVGRGLARGGR